MALRPMPGPPETPLDRWSRRLGPVVDLGVAGWLGWHGWQAWQRFIALSKPAGDGFPALATRADLYLDGPDAAAWAQNAWAMAENRRGDLDMHRLPSWPWLVGMVQREVGDIAVAGHLVNHALLALLPVLVWFAARAVMGRGMALAAALVAASRPIVVWASVKYGVDPLVAAAVPLAMLAGAGAGRFWLLSPAFGALVAFACATHLSTLGLAVPAALLCLGCGGRSWRRWVGFVGLAVGFWWGLEHLFQNYPRMSLQNFRNAIDAGVTTSAPGARGMDRQFDRDVVALGLQVFATGSAWLLAQLRPANAPWWAMTGLLWLGMLGPGLFRPPAMPEQPSRARRGWQVARWVLGGAVAGAGVLAAAAPLFVFVKAQAPDRYTYNFMAPGVILLFRGAASAAAIVDLALAALVGLGAARLPERARPWVRWPSGLLGLWLGWRWMGALPGEWQGPGRPGGMEPTAVVSREVGAALAKAFPGPGPAVCRVWEVASYAGKRRCGPSWMIAPGGTDMAREVAVMRAECPGRDVIPYVAVSGIQEEQRMGKRDELEAWIAEKYGPPVATWSARGARATIYGIPRQE